MGIKTSCRGGLSGVISLMALVQALPALAGDVAALILEADGSIAPAVEVYDQVAAGTALELGDGARLEFAHMARCTVVTVEGRGRLAFTARAYDWSGATPDRAETGACIARVTYQNADMAPAGIGFRAAKLPHLAPRPVFILEGFAASSNYEVKIKPLGDESDEILLELPRSVAAWPDEVPPLEAGRAYELTLVRDGRASASNQVFMVPPSNDGDAAVGPILLRFH